MAVLKRKVNSEAKGFAPYAGEDPRPGVYRARIIKSSIREASTGRLSYNTFFELEAQKPEHKQYDGYAAFCEIYLGDETEEWAQAGESAFVKAITGKSNFQNVNVAYEGKEADFKTGTGALIKTLDGVKVENKIVNVNLRMEKERTHEGTKYPAELRARGILPWENKQVDDEEEEVDEDAIAEADESEEVAEDEEEGEEMTDEEWEAAKEARRVELKSREYDLAKLRAVLKENDIETKGLKKPELVEAIIGLEYPEDEEGEDEEGISEDDVEVDEDAETESDEDEESEEDEEDEDEEEEDEEEDEEEEDEESEVDLREEIEAEAADLDRSALKREIKKLDATAKFTTKQTDDDLRSIFVDLKVSAPGF